METMFSGFSGGGNSPVQHGRFHRDKCESIIDDTAIQPGNGRRGRGVAARVGKLNGRTEILLSKIRKKSLQ